MKRTKSRREAGVPGKTSVQKLEERAKGPNPGGWLKKVFCIDGRSLAMFRIAMGLLLLCDLWVRWGDLEAIYSDAGMFPRGLVARYTSEWNWSLHFVSGEWGGQAVLFGVAGLFALALLAGFQTRIATIGSWLLLLSVQHRAPAILSGAEILFRMLLFWGMFLPLNRAWSADCWIKTGKISPEEKDQIFSAGTAAILMQMCLMYLCSAFFKTNEQWMNGEVLAGVMVHEFFASTTGKALAEYGTLMKLSTWGSLALEWLGPLMLLAPKWQVRLAGVILLALMHLGIAIFLEVGMFSYVAMAGLTLFVPRKAWDFFAKKTDLSSEKWVPGSLAGNVIAGAALIYVLVTNLSSLKKNEAPENRSKNFGLMNTGLGLQQRWGMFEAVPSKSGWYVAKGLMKDGTQIDLLQNGAPLSWSKPEEPLSGYPNHYWVKLFREMTYEDSFGFHTYRQPAAEYLCRKWNKENPSKKVIEVELVFCMVASGKNESPLRPLLQREQLAKVSCAN